jgi:hypothetical protein
MHFKKESSAVRTSYSGNVLNGLGRRGGESGQPWRDFDPDAKGRHSAIGGEGVDCQTQMPIGVPVRGAEFET